MSAPSTSGLSVELLLRVIDVKYGRLTILYYTILYYTILPYYMKFWRHFNLANLAIFQNIAKLKCTKIKCR